jgi:hypothetical protein
VRRCPTGFSPGKYRRTVSSLTIDRRDLREAIAILEQSSRLQRMPSAVK